MKEQILHWLLALIRSVVQGSATSLKAFFGVAGASVATSGAVPALNLKQALAILAFSAVYNAVDFLSKNPTPDADDLPTPAETTNPAPAQTQ